MNHKQLLLRQQGDTEERIVSDYMYTTFDFYTYVYYGSKLKEENFDKFISKAEGIIAKNTGDRVNETTLNTFPELFITKVKKCACELAEYMSDVDKVNSSIISNSDGSIGAVSSKKAGEVTVSYETSKSVSSYTNQKEINLKYKSILNDYLYMQSINGKVYNVLSWVGCHVCDRYNFI